MDVDFQYSGQLLQERFNPGRTLTREECVLKRRHEAKSHVDVREERKKLAGTSGDREKYHVLNCFSEAYDFKFVKMYEAITGPLQNDSCLTLDITL